MPRPSTALTWIVLAALIALVPIELLLQYDTLVRQVALSITDIAAILFLVFLGRWLRRQGSSLHPSAILLVGAAVWLDALGNFLHYYARFVWWDQLTHAVGTASVTYAAFAALAALLRAERLRLGTVAHGVFAVCIGTTIAALYEISEYLGDRWFGTNRVTDRYDSPDDLLWNFLASILVVLLAAWAVRRSRHRTSGGGA